MKILGEVRKRHPFLLVGYVLKPEHVHLLVSEPARGTPSKIVQVLKQRVSRALRKKKRRSSTGQLCLRPLSSRRGGGVIPHFPTLIGALVRDGDRKCGGVAWPGAA